MKKSLMKKSFWFGLVFGLSIAGAVLAVPTAPQSAFPWLTTLLAGKQPIDPDLTSIAAQTGTGYAKRTGTDTWTISGSVAWSELSSVPSTFTPPIATASVLGGVKIGANVSVDAAGLISVAAPLTVPNGLALGNGSTFSVYGGLACTNQFLRSMTGAGVATCASVGNSDFAVMPANSFKCNATTGSAVPTDCTSIPAAIQGGLLGDVDPSVYGWTAFSEDPNMVTSVQALASGVIRCSINRATKATSSVAVIYDVSTAGATLTAGQNLISIYSSSTVNGTYTKIGTSAAQEAIWNSVGLKTTAAITLSPALAAGNFVAVCFLSVGTTAPKFRAILAPTLTLASITNKIKLISAAAKTATDATFTIGASASGTVYASTTNQPWWGLQ